jgi:hypothetical protein
MGRLAVNQQHQLSAPTLIPLPWKIGVGLALAGAAVVARVQDKAALSIKQNSINAIITKAKNEEHVPVGAHIATERVRVGRAVCNGSAAPRQSRKHRQRRRRRFTRPAGSRRR